MFINNNELDNAMIGNYEYNLREYSKNIRKTVICEIMIIVVYLFTSKEFSYSWNLVSHQDS